MFGKIITRLAEGISLIVLIFTFKPSTALQILLLAIVLTLFFIAIVLDLKAFYQNSPKKFKSDIEINNYMHRLISKTGRVVVFSRRMSWGDKPAMRDLLIKKAKARELEVILPSNTKLSEELSKNGATVLTYNEIGYEPEARFTIFKRGSMSEQLAIGRWEKEIYLINEYAKGQHPLYSIANDLVKLIEKNSGKK